MKRMKVVLVYPGISSLGFDSFGLGAEGSWINHGLCSISASVKKRGHEVCLVDLRRLAGWDDLKRTLQRIAPDVVGVTMMSVDYDFAIRSVAVAKEAVPAAVTVVGGPHPSIMPEELMQEPAVDYVVKGEGEISFPDLLDQFAAGHRPAEKLIQGVPPDLDALPFTDRDLFEGREKPWWLTDREPFVTVIAGRGCIYNCSFCQPAERHIFGRKVRRRSVENVITELRELEKKYGFRAFMFHDDCLIEDEAWVLEFCRRYREEGFTQEFICQGRSDIICRKTSMLKALREAGLIGIIIGFESGNQRILNFMRKGTTVEQNYKAAEICHELGLRFQANYMLGLPTETRAEAEDTLRMIEAINPDCPAGAIFTPMPGSDLYEYCRKNELINYTGHGYYRRDTYTSNKIKGVDYPFLIRENNKLLRKKFRLHQIAVKAVVQYLTRKNKLTLEIIKRLTKIPLLNRVAHIAVRIQNRR